MADTTTQGNSGDAPSVLDPDLGRDAPMPRDVRRPHSAPRPPAREEPQIDATGVDEPETAEELDEDLDEQVGAMIAEARRQQDLEDGAEDSAPPEEDPAPVAEPDPAPDADKARARSLADLTFELLESDLGDDLSDFDAPEEGAPAPADDATDKSGAGASRTPTHTPGSQRSTDATERHGAARLVSVAGLGARRLALVAWRRVVPLGARGVLEVNKPLESRSATLRQTVGWLALYTAFLAVCVWVYVLLVRTPPEAIASDTPAGMVTEPQGSGLSSSPAPPASPSLSGSLSSVRDARQD
ncbi:MAG: hypothetical protein ACF8Q5_13185 [Phycisphaerales bacterium JB040]